MRPLFLDRPDAYVLAQRTSYDRVRDGYAGTVYRRRTTWADRAARALAAALVLAALVLLVLR